MFVLNLNCKELYFANISQRLKTVTCRTHKMTFSISAADLLLSFRYLVDDMECKKCFSLHSCTFLSESHVSPQLLHVYVSFVFLCFSDPLKVFPPPPTNTFKNIIYKFCYCVKKSTLNFKLAFLRH